MNVTRRKFIQTTGAVVIHFSIGGCRPGSDGESSATVYDSRIAVHPDGSVDLHLGKVELGQGIGTALAQIAADELHVAFENIRLIGVDTDFSPDESYTFSSISIQQSAPKVREAARQARAALNASTTAASATIPRFVGKSMPRIDIPGKVFGEPSFIQDYRAEGMLHARVVRPPAERAKLSSIDSGPIKSMDGVRKVLRDGNFVAVVAKREGQARRAARALHGRVEWEFADDVPATDTVFDWLKTAESRTEVIVSRGNVDMPDSGETALRSTYRRPYQAHASISPSAALARFDDDRLTVWSHAQGMYPLRSAIAHVVGMAEENVRCVHIEASGCYGHNGADDAACDVAAIAMQLPGETIRLQWERDDEFLWEPLGPAMNIEVQASLDADRKIRSWTYDLWSCPHASRPRGSDSAGHLIYATEKTNPLRAPDPYSIPQPSGGSDRNAVPLYDIPNLQVNKHFITDIPIRGSSLRGLGAYGNVFAIESFMDELAQAANADPFEFRRRQLLDRRAIEVLNELQKRSNWQARPEEGQGIGWGLAFAQFKNLSSYLGVVVKLRIDTARDVQIRLQHVTAVCDAGLIISPDGIRAQIEGGIVQSASWTLKEQVHLSKRGRESRDWSSYPIMRFDEVPEIDVHLINRGNEKSLGVGETAQGPTAAAIGNALFHATGQRKRQLPLIASRMS